MSNPRENTKEELRIIDRRSGEIFIEKILGGSLMHLAYHSPLHPLLKHTLFQTGLISRILGFYTRLGISRPQIRPTIKALDIDTSEFEKPVESFRNFHQFFVRKLKTSLRPFDPDPEIFCSPADARLSLIPRLEGETLIPVKGRAFTLAELCRRQDLRRFHGGIAMIFRLSPADYHRYHFPANGRLIESREISGRYDSVHPTALELGLPVFAENRRVLSLLELENFGSCLFVEVGAFGVGGIIQTHQGKVFEKGAEKGYFQYGASSLVLVLEAGSINLDPDLKSHGRTELEILVRAGEGIARR